MDNRLPVSGPGSWQDRLDLLLMIGISAAEVAHLAGALSLRDVQLVVAAALGVAVLGYLVSILRGDTDRPATVMPLAVLLGVLVIHQIAFGHPWPLWVQALVFGAVLLYLLVPRDDPGAPAQTRMHDRPPPY